MSLRRISVEKMVALSEALLTTHKSALEQIPQTAGILLSIEAAHNHLFRVGEQTQVAVPTAREVYKQQVKFDSQHDNYLRCGYYHLGSLIALYAAREDTAKIEQLTKLREVLYPDGLGGTNLSYDEESGAATLLERAVTEEMKATLSGIIIEKASTGLVTLWDVVELQISLAKEIGVLEQKKNAAQAADAQSAGFTLRDQKRAVDSWINAIRTLEKALRLVVNEKKITKEAADNFLREIREAEEKADREHLLEVEKKTEEPKA